MVKGSDSDAPADYVKQRSYCFGNVVYALFFFFFCKYFFLFFGLVRFGFINNLYLLSNIFC